MQALEAMGKQRLASIFGLALIGASAYCGIAQAMDFSELGDYQPALHVNGRSYHFARKGQVEFNYGLGFSVSLVRLNSGSPILDGAKLGFEFDEYRDSFGHTAFSVGGFLQQGLSGHWDWGAKFGLDHETSITQHGLYVFPYVVPYVESKFRFPVNIRVIFIPPVPSYTDGFLAFQGIVKF